jgi:L-lactate dehydrogenase (cytochrome)
MSEGIAYEDYRRKARRRLPRMLFDYIDGGAYGEVTLGRNTRDMEAIALRQRVMRDMSSLQLSTKLFGQALSMPVVLGPAGFSGMYARRGEVQAAAAARAAGVPFCLSSLSICSFEELATAHPTPI